MNLSVDFTLPKANTDKSNHSVLHQALSIIPANQTLVNKQRSVLEKNYRRASINNQIVTIDHTDADASFILPNLFEFPDDVRLRIMNSLIDTTTKIALEKTKRLNWWVDQKFPCPRLYPLVTSGDGNCLLHATSLAMWGFHDHALSLRKALNKTLVTLKANNSLYRRWRWAQSVQHKKYHLVYSENEWDAEWKNILRLSSTEPRNSQVKTFGPKKSPGKSSTPKLTRPFYQSLEEFHVYVLANNIRRPIVVFSERVLRSIEGEAISPIDFGGIYLPLEIPPEKCYKQPIFLAFNVVHFSALVPMESKVAYQIPLVDLETLELLPIHFFHDPGCNFQWPLGEELSDEKMNRCSTSQQNQMNILERYLNLSKEYSSLDGILSTSSSEIEHVHNDQIPSMDSTNHRRSLNALSKNICRKIVEPFSSTKRMLHKHQPQHLSVINGNTPPQQRSPIINLRTNKLTIILTNFQPKRLKISDHMIKNYLETYIGKDDLKTNGDSHTKLSVNNLSSVYCRHHRRNSSIDQTSTLTQNNQMPTKIKYAL